MSTETQNTNGRPSGLVKPTPRLPQGQREAMDRAADRLERKGRELEAQGGLKAKIGQALRQDADLLRRMKPSLVAERVRGEKPALDSQKTTVSRLPESTKQPAPRSSPARQGKSPFLVIGAGLAAGVSLAKLIDWRGYAHPR